MVEWFGGQDNELRVKQVEFRCLAWTRATDVTSSTFVVTEAFRVDEIACEGQDSEPSSELNV